MIVHRKAGERGRADFGWLDSRHSFSFGPSLNQAAETSPSGARSRTWHRNQISYSPRPRRSSGWQRPSRLFGSPRSPSLARLLTFKSARHARRPFSSATAWPHDIRSTTGVTPKSICIGPAWPETANKNDWQSAASVLVYRRFSV